MDIDDVSAAIRAAEAEAVAPRFEALSEADVVEKAAGELVTVADRECERLLIDSLRTIDDVPVVGEEGVAADPTLLRHLADGDCWLVDPLDGTSNFVAGSPNHAVMVARVSAGLTVASWMWQPRHHRLAVAERSNGAFVDGRRVRVGPVGPPASWAGVVKDRFVPDGERWRYAAAAGTLRARPEAAGAAGIEYVDLVLGSIQLLAYWRTLPWDHAPGALFVEEAGGGVCRLDGSAYEPASTTAGLVAAVDAAAALGLFR